MEKYGIIIIEKFYTGEITYERPPFFTIYNDNYSIVTKGCNYLEYEIAPLTGNIQVIIPSNMENIVVKGYDSKNGNTYIFTNHDSQNNGIAKGKIYFEFTGEAYGSIIVIASGTDLSSTQVIRVDNSIDYTSDVSIVRQVPFIYKDYEDYFDTDENMCKAGVTTIYGPNSKVTEYSKFEDGILYIGDGESIRLDISVVDSSGFFSKSSKVTFESYLDAGIVVEGLSNISRSTHTIDISHNEDYGRYNYLKPNLSTGGTYLYFDSGTHYYNYDGTQNVKTGTTVKNSTDEVEGQYVGDICIVYTELFSRKDVTFIIPVVLQVRDVPCYVEDYSYGDTQTFEEFSNSPLLEKENGVIMYKYNKY